MENSKSFTKDKIRVMVAYVGGANIQSRDRRINGVWHNISQPSWDWDTYEYRINPVQEIFVKGIDEILSVETRKDIDITKVIFNKPVTVVFWSDGSKTVVKANHEIFDPEKGLAMSIAKKAFGNKGNYFNEFKKWIPKDNHIELRIDKTEDQEYHVSEDAKSTDEILSLEG